MNKELELALLQLWKSNDVDSVYKYNNRIYKFVLNPGAKISLFYDVAWETMFMDVYDIGSDETTRPEQAKVKVSDLIKARTGERQND